ncbi:MAG: flavodoxin domain-containing protein [Acidimicrobiia bacterium]|nr:flavodoxin domain-containing protein [Acidimicrobiia bacterium]
MEVVIVYESLTGTTRAAALAMADEFFSHRVPCRTFPIVGVDADAVAAADVVVVGSWTDGALVVGQRPGRARRLRESLPSLEGKRCAVYCTYAITPGKTLGKLDRLVTEAGGSVFGGLAIRRTEVREGARTLVDGILDAAVV